MGMKKIIKYVVSAMLGVAVLSCGGTHSGNGVSVLEDSTSVTVSPYDLKSSGRGEEQSVYGVAVDRAMNSLVVMTAEGDTMSFEYPDVEENFKFARPNIGDSVTVKYIRTDYQDSVTAVLRGKVL